MRTAKPRTILHRPPAGFTLIELIVVIVILGVLAAAALPKFVDFRTDARAASLKQLAGALRSTSDMVRAKCIVTGCRATFNESLSLNGTARQVWWGYPIENSRSNAFWGINDLVEHSGFDYTISSGSYPLSAYFSLTSAPSPSNCRVTYTYTESSSPPQITVDSSGC